MPKRKLHESDIDSGGPSDDSDVRRDEGRGGDTVEKPNPLQPSLQIKGFLSQQELAKYARTLGLKRVMLADLQQQSDLEDRYVGGQVMGHYSLSFSQGHDLAIFIQDKTTTHGSQPKHLKVTICNELAENMPTLREDAKLFLYKAVVKEDSRDFSQDHGKCLLVESPDAQVWIVHRDVQKPYFFTETCGKKWWSKTKKKREQMKSMWSVESTGGSLRGPDVVASTIGETSGTTPGGVGPHSVSDMVPSVGEPLGGPDTTPLLGGPDTTPLLGGPDTTSLLRGPDNAPLGGPDMATSGMDPLGGATSIGGTSDAAPNIEGTSDAAPNIEGTSDAAPNIEGASKHKYSTRSKFTSDVVHTMESDNFPDFPNSAFKEGDAEVPSSETMSSCFEDGESNSSSSSSSSSEDSDREWSTRHYTSSKREYRYRKLGDINIGDKKVNIIAVVKEFKPPSLTRGSDYYSTLTLVDETDPRVGVKCIMFNRNPEKLPQVKRVGDIVCLHRVLVESHNCQPQVQSIKFSSVSRFSGNPSKSYTPSTGSVSFTCTIVEKRRVKELRVWARRQRRCCLESVAPDEYFDLVAQVVCVTISKVPHCTVLTVWDATVLQLPCKEVRLEKRHEEGYPIVKDKPGLSQESEGYQVHVVVYNKKCMRKASRVIPGQFLHLQGVHSAVMDGESTGDGGGAAGAGGTVELCMHREDGVLNDVIPPRLQVLNEERDDFCADVGKRLRKAAESVTVTCHPTQPAGTIAKLTAYTGAYPAKFRCRVRVLSMITPSLEEMVLTRCHSCDNMEGITPTSDIGTGGVARDPCPVCSSEQRTSHPVCQYYFKMLVGDGTGTIELEVAHEQGTKLFNGLEASSFYQYQQARRQLLEKLSVMTGGNPPFAAAAAAATGCIIDRPRPWLDCCLLVVEHLGSLYYCLFDTELKPPATTNTSSPIANSSPS